MRQTLEALLMSLGGSHDQQWSRLCVISLRFYQRMHTDIMIGFFFTGRDLTVISKRNAAFLWQSAGRTLPNAPELEASPLKAPKTAHEALPPILQGHFDRRLRLLQELLTQEGLTPENISAWINFEEAFRKQVIQSGRA